MLLQHAWLAPLLKPTTIAEEDEEAAEQGAPLEAKGNGEVPVGGLPPVDGEGFVDREVGEWVIEALERKRSGKMGAGARPALHAAPLDRGDGGKKDVKPVAVDA